jgi:hypothetical protein
MTRLIPMSVQLMPTEMLSSLRRREDTVSMLPCSSSWSIPKAYLPLISQRQHLSDSRGFHGRTRSNDCIARLA